MDSQKGLKFILLGDSTVGKSCIMLNFVGKPFRVQRISTVGIDKESRYVDYQGGSIFVTVWDTAGQEKYRGALPRNIFTRIHGALLVFDINNPNSFANVHNWMEIIKTQAPENTATVLIANKMDLPHKITEEQCLKIAEEFAIPFQMTSAKDGVNIEEAFAKLIEEAVKRNPTVLIEKDEDLRSVDLTQRNDKRICCRNV